MAHTKSTHYEMTPADEGFAAARADAARTATITKDVRMMTLIDAQDEADQAASQPGLSNETFNFLLGVKAGLERAIKILEAKQ